MPRETKNISPEKSIAWRVLGLLKELAVALGIIVISMTIFGHLRAPDLPDQAPDFTLRDLQGNLVSLEAYRGKPVVLNFWATWCGPCKIEIPSFSKFAANNPNIPVLGIAIDGTADELRQARKNLDINYRILMGSNSVQDAYGVESVPTTIIVAPDGKVSSAHAGIMMGPQLEWATRHW